MTFTYDKNLNTIRKYTILDDSIEIEYLDGKEATVKYDEQIESTLLSNMFTEAIKRDESLNREMKERLIANASILGTADIAAILFAITSKYGVNYKECFIALISTFTLISSMIISKQHDEYKELKKYKKYFEGLKFKEEIAGFKANEDSSETLDGFSLEAINGSTPSYYDVNGVNINNIDELSYSKIKKRIKEFKSTHKNK